MTNRTKSEFTSHCESLRRRTSWWCCCCSQPVSRMLATVLEWLTDFLTGAIMESRKAARSKAVASPPWWGICSFSKSKWQMPEGGGGMAGLEYLICSIKNFDASRVSHEWHFKLLLVFLLLYDGNWILPSNYMYSFSQWIALGWLISFDISHLYFWKF